MSKPVKTVVKVIEIGDGKLLVLGVVTREQLKAIYDEFEPLSRSWRGQFQSLAKAIVEAYNRWANTTG